MSDLTFLEIKENKQYYKEMKKLYNEAFPKNERVPFTILKLLLRKEKAKFYGIYDENNFVGLVYNVFYKDIVYIFYLAINQELRGQGYGSKVLDSIKSKYKHSRIILMIEEIDEKSKNYKDRIKRRNFYYNNGFKNLNYKIREANVIYEMLGYSEDNKKVTNKEFYELMKNYFGNILYKYAYKKISEEVK